MKLKTISGHYDSTFSLAHNNRVFLSKNVDESRVCNNYCPVMAGFPIAEFIPDCKSLQQQWEDYRMLSDIYWGRLKKERADLLNIIATERRRNWTILKLLDDLSDCGLLSLLLMPLIITLTTIEVSKNIVMVAQYKADLEKLRTEADFFRACQSDLRNALRAHDLNRGTELLSFVDRIVGHCENLSDHLWGTPTRFATEEEIYEKVFEKSFQDFQAKQRSCRRYSGTYLEQIRERTMAAHKKTVGKTDKLRTMSEAIEVVFTIGDMDTTGYANATEDALKAEKLLNDFCNHLLSSHNTCVVTDRELNNPYWVPPFKHGLIVLNLVAHYDEATPGVHLTVIPYTSGCKRGPDKQPSMGRAFAGMGYTSTWEACLDEHGNPIPKRDRNGNIILDRDGSVRIKQTPKHQGIIDWIEEQKIWINEEMRKRYGWVREYKGSNPRGNLCTYDYKVAKAQERLSSIEAEMSTAIRNYIEHATRLTNQVTASLSDVLDESAVDTIIGYLATCPQERFDIIFEEACAYFNLAHDESRKKLKASLMDQIASAKSRTKHEQLQSKHNITVKKER